MLRLSRLTCHIYERETNQFVIPILDDSITQQLVEFLDETFGCRSLLFSAHLPCLGKSKTDS